MIYAFTEELFIVCGYIESYTVKEELANWIERLAKRKRNGRQAMIEVKTHFDA